MTTTSPTELTCGGAPKTRRPLWEIVAALNDAIEAADGEVTAAVDAIEAELADKAEAYHIVMQAYTAKKAANIAVVEHFSDKAEQAERAHAALKARLEQAMRDTGVERIEAQTVTVSFQKSQHVEITEPELFLLSAEDRFIKRGADSIIKAEVAKALKAGEAVEYARMAETKHLRFR